MEIPPPPPPAVTTPPPIGFPILTEPQKPSRAKKILRFAFWFMLAMSIFLNIYLTALIAASMTGDVHKTVLVSGKPDQVIAVYAVNGVIDGKAADQFNAFYKSIIKDENVRAVVLRVDSPGGGIAASDQIANSVAQIKKAGKKVVVSMGGTAASGGYYISAGADAIFAEPTTITGSIGVIMSWVVMKDGLNKIGVEPIVMKSRNSYNWKDEISVFKEPDAQHKEHLQQILDNMQARFEQVVKDGRGERLKPAPATSQIASSDTQPAKGPKLPAEIEPLNGKIYLAQDALKFGLVDEIGYQANAIEKAKTLAVLDNPTVVQYSKRVGLMEKMFEGKSAAALIDMQAVDDLRTPRLEMRWTGQ